MSIPANPIALNTCHLDQRHCSLDCTRRDILAMLFGVLTELDFIDALANPTARSR
ncbi:MAG: hypothetical protein ACYDEY_15045 [Acidimicrobiales bacterium]